MGDRQFVARRSSVHGDSWGVIATLHVAITYMLPLFGEAMSVTTLSGF